MTASSSVVDLLNRRQGHFELESGHHGNTWLDLDALFLRPARLAPFIDDLAELTQRVAQPDAVCGPMYGGGLIAHEIAARLDVELFVAEQVKSTTSTNSTGGDGSAELFQMRYAVTGPTRALLAGKRVSVVDDVINAGSATRATIQDLRSGGAEVVSIGALLVLGDSAGTYAKGEGLPLTYTASLNNQLWEPVDCPLCTDGVPLEDVTIHS